MLPPSEGGVSISCKDGDVRSKSAPTGTGKTLSAHQNERFTRLERNPAGYRSRGTFPAVGHRSSDRGIGGLRAEDLIQDARRPLQPFDLPVGCGAVLQVSDRDGSLTCDGTKDVPPLLDHRPLRSHLEDSDTEPPGHQGDVSHNSLGCSKGSYLGTFGLEHGPSPAGPATSELLLPFNGGFMEAPVCIRQGNDDRDRLAPNSLLDPADRGRQKLLHVPGRTECVTDAMEDVELLLSGVTSQGSGVPFAGRGEFARRRPKCRLHYAHNATPDYDICSRRYPPKGGQKVRLDLIPRRSLTALRSRGGGPVEISDYHAAGEVWT